MLRPVSLLLFAVLLLVSSSALAGGPVDPARDLIYMTEEYWPMNYTRDGHPDGLSVALLKLMWREMGIPEQPIEIYPWPRAYTMLQADPRTMVFAMYRTREREDAFKWVGPIADGKAEVYALRTRGLAAHSLRDLKGYRLAAVRDVASANFLEAAGLPFTGTGHSNAAIEMLKLDRVDAVAMDSFQFHHFVEELGYPQDAFEPILLLCADPLYYAFSRDTPDALIRRFQKALDKIMRMPGYQALRARYLN